MTLWPCDKWDDMPSSIEACIEDIGIWMKSNMLKLDKTKFIVSHSSNK